MSRPKLGTRVTMDFGYHTEKKYVKEGAEGTVKSLGPTIAVVDFGGKVGTVDVPIAFISARDS